MLDFSGQTVLVTGASSGIGAAVARGFATLGAHTIVHYHRNADGAAATQQSITEAGGTATTVRADLSDSASAKALVDQVYDEHKRIDVLVNNAGDLVRRAPVAEVSDDDFRSTMDINVTSVFSICRQVVPLMQRQGHGSIVNISSVAARTGGGGGSVIYAASKGAVSTFTRGLAKEVAGDGIRVNAVAPGIITTPFHERHTEDRLMEAMVGSIPMGRAGEPEECVGAVVFLASPSMSGYITGQVVEVNGGQLTP